MDSIGTVMGGPVCPVVGPEAWGSPGSRVEAGTLERGPGSWSSAVLSARHRARQQSASSARLEQDGGSTSVPEVVGACLLLGALG